jgi:hypothetical protein
MLENSQMTSVHEFDALLRAYGKACILIGVSATIEQIDGMQESADRLRRWYRELRSVYIQARAQLYELHQAQGKALP